MCSFQQFVAMHSQVAGGHMLYALRRCRSLCITFMSESKRLFRLTVSGLRGGIHADSSILVGCQPEEAGQV